MFTSSNSFGRQALVFIILKKEQEMNLKLYALLGIIFVFTTTDQIRYIDQIKTLTFSLYIYSALSAVRHFHKGSP
jgi:hypothetical protein